MSIAGHMWYSLQQEDEVEQSYGFMSVHSKPFFDDGKVSTENNYVYYRPRYKRTMVIEQKKYQKLKEFGDNQDVRLQNKFTDKYNVSSNSCIYFTWLALKYAGFWWQVAEFKSSNGLSIFPASLCPLNDLYEGRLIPSSN